MIDLSNFAQDLADVANFATYFIASPAALSTPHLYISSLATWPKSSAVVEGWHKQFPLILSFRHINRKDSHTVPLVTMLTDSSVYCVAFSDDGSCIVSGSYDGSVRMWDVLSGVELKMLNGHSGSPVCCIL